MDAFGVIIGFNVWKNIEPGLFRIVIMGVWNNL